MIGCRRRYRYSIQRRPINASMSARGEFLHRMRIASRGKSARNARRRRRRGKAPLHQNRNVIVDGLPAVPSAVEKPAHIAARPSCNEPRAPSSASNNPGERWLAACGRAAKESQHASRPSKPNSAPARHRIVLCALVILCASGIMSNGIAGA